MHNLFSYYCSGIQGLVERNAHPEKPGGVLKLGSPEVALSPGCRVEEREGHQISPARAIRGTENTAQSSE